MGILKKKCGRPRKNGAAPQKTRENCENDANAQDLSIDKLTEGLIGKYITFAKGDFHSQFRIAEVAKAYGNVEVRETIGGGNGDVLMLSMECASDLIRCGYFLTDVSSFSLTETDPETGTASQKETEERPTWRVHEPEAVAPALDDLTITAEEAERTAVRMETEPKELKVSHIVLDGIGEVEGSFLDLLSNLKDHGCAPMLVHRASKAADRLYEALYEMEKWYREKEGSL